MQADKPEPIVLLIHGTFSNLPAENPKSDEAKAKEKSGFWRNLIGKRFKKKKSDTPLPERGLPGGGWWKPDSDFSNSLKENLEPLGVVIAGDKQSLSTNPDYLTTEGQTNSDDSRLISKVDVFEWSSENTERERYKAGKALLERLLEYEREGRDYHLIGHSHGGSVIWQALQQSVMRRWASLRFTELLRLPHLKSWATVGTPFLHYKGGWIGKWYGKAITILMFIVSVALTLQLGFREYRSWSEENPIDVIGAPVAEWLEELQEKAKKKRGMQEAGEKSVAQGTSDGTPETVTPSSEPTPEQTTERGDRSRPQVFGANTAKGFREDIAHAQNAFGELKDIQSDLERSTTRAPVTPLHWCATLAQLLLTFLFLVAPFFLFYFWTRARRTEAHTVLRENKAQSRAMIDFGDRWLGIWSTEDEAINGLQATTQITKAKVLPRFVIPSETVFSSDRIIRIYRFFLRGPAWFYNQVLNPILNTFLMSQVAKKAQGNNRFGARLEAVSEGPIIINGYRYPPLPEEVDKELIGKANLATENKFKDIIAETRTSFLEVGSGLKDLPGMASSIAETLGGDELVHNSYFKDDFVRRALSLQIQEAHAGDPLELMQRKVPPPLPEKVDDGKRWLKIVIWLAIGFALGIFVFFEMLERENSVPTLALSGGLAATGIALIITAIQSRKTEPRSSVVKASVIGTVISLLAIIFGLLPKIFPVLTSFQDLAESTQFAHPGFVLGCFLLTTIVLSAAAVLVARRRSLLAKTFGYLALASAIGGIWIADWVTEVEGLSFIIAFLFVGAFCLFKALTPLWRCLDALSESEKEPAVEGIRPSYLTEDNNVTNWYLRLKENIRAKVQRSERVYDLGLPMLSKSNDLAIFTPFIFLVSAIPLVTAPIGLIASITPAIRASRGAPHGKWVFPVFHFVLFCLMVSVLALFATFVRDVLTPPRANLARNVAFVESEHTLASIHQGGVVLWDLKNREAEKLPSPSGTRWTLVRSGAKGRRLAAVSGRKIGLWNPSMSEFLVDLEGHEADVSALAFSSDERILVSGDMKGDLRFWEFGRPTVSIPQGKPILGIACHSDPKNNLAAVGLGGGHIAIWDLEKRKRLAKERLHQHDVVSLAFGSERIISLDEEGGIAVSRFNGGKLKKQPKKSWPKSIAKRMESYTPRHVTSSSDGAHFALIYESKEDQQRFLSVLGPEEIGWSRLEISGQSGGFAMIPTNEYPMTKARLAGAFIQGDQIQLRTDVRQTDFVELKMLDVQMCALSNDRKLIATTTENQEIRWWNLDDGTKEVHCEGHWDVIRAIAFHPTGKVIASGGDDRLVKLWNTGTGQELLELKGHTDWVRSLAFSRDGKFLASGADDTTIRIWDLGTGETVGTLTGHEGYVTHLAFSEGGEVLLSGGSYNEIKIWDWTGDRSFRKGFSGGSMWNSVTAIAISPDASLAACASSDSSVNVWDVNSGIEVFSEEEFSGDIVSLAISPQNRWLATATSDHKVKLWNIKNGTERYHFGEHADRVHYMKFARNGKELITVSADDTVKTWDVANGILLESKPQYRFEEKAATETADAGAK